MDFLTLDFQDQKYRIQLKKILKNFPHLVSLK